MSTSLSIPCVIDTAVAARFPDIKIAGAVLRGITVRPASSAISSGLEAVARRLRAELHGRPPQDLPHLAAFRTVYKDFGVDPGSRRPSVEALVRRAIDPTRALYRINAVVDAYNLTSLECVLPFGAYDIDSLALPLVLRFACGNENFLGIGETTEVALTAGELVYADQERIVCRDYNYRDADISKVTNATKNVLILADACGPIPVERAQEALQAAVERILAECGGTAVDQFSLPSIIHSPDSVEG